MENEGIVLFTIIKYGASHRTGAARTELAQG